MKNKASLILTTALILPLMLWMSPGSQTLKSFKMSISGTSTLHKWESGVTALSVKSDINISEGGLEAINSLSIEVDVKSIKSEHGAMMDKKTWEALKATQFPKITYQLTKVESITSSGAGEYDIKALGNLSIAGVKLPIDMNVKGKILNGGNLSFKGAKKIKMSDFKMEAPTALMGTIKTGNEITVTFDIVLGN
jgi:polyisoprenoid-binding protein YceI